MSYNANNKAKWMRYVSGVYSAHKHYDVPDSFIVRNVFPRHGIFISYGQWMKIKNAAAQSSSAEMRTAGLGAKL